MGHKTHKATLGGGLFYQQPEPTITIWLNGLKKS